MKFIMRNLSLVVLVLASIFLTSCEKDSDAETPDPGGETPANDVAAEMLLLSLPMGDTSVPMKVVSPTTYVEHNPHAADGREALIQSILDGTYEKTEVNVVRTFATDDMVVLHSEYKVDDKDLVVFDVYKFENDLIVEHWDNRQENLGTNTSGITMTEGATTIENEALTAENETIARDFVQQVFVETQFETANDFLVDGKLVQHSHLLPDSLAMLSASDSMGTDVPLFKYDQLHMTIGEGNFVLTLSEGTYGEDQEPTAFYNLFRIQDGKIVEHWDVIQAIPPQDDWMNANGKF